MYAAEHAKSRKSGLPQFLVKLVIVVVLIAAASYALRSYVIEPFQVPSASMEDTIMTGDMVFTEKVSYRSSSPAPKDIVVFPDPQISSRVLIKRVIATEGQTINFIDGKVYIDGVALSEPYAQGATYPLTTAGNVSITYPYTVPAGYVWVMGDNRENSADSRYFGPVQTSGVFGKAVLTYWPFDRIGLLE